MAVPRQTGLYSANLWKERFGEGRPTPEGTMHAPSHSALAPDSRKHGTGPVLAPSKPLLQLPRSSVFHGFRAKQEESDTEVIPEASLTCPTDSFF